jgi:hypothetical protein
MARAAAPSQESPEPFTSRIPLQARDKSASRRVTNALTAAELYESVSDKGSVPEPLVIRGRYASIPACIQRPIGDPLVEADDLLMVPEPLQLSKSTRTASAPAKPFHNVETCIMVTPASPAHDENAKAPASLLRGEWYALIDTAARLLASGVPAADVAEDMGLSSDELIDRLALLAVTSRDSTASIMHDINIFFGATSETEHAGDPATKLLDDGGDEDNELFSKVLDKWTTKHEEETSLENVHMASPIKSSDTNVDNHKKNNAAYGKCVETYYDTPDRYTESTFQTSFANQETRLRAFGCFASDGALRNAPAQMDTEDDDQCLEAAKSREWGKMIPPNTSVSWWLTAAAVMCGRMAGVILYETQRELHSGTWSLPWSALGNGNVLIQKVATVLVTTVAST